MLPREWNVDARKLDDVYRVPYVANLRFGGVIRQANAFAFRETELYTKSFVIV
jgi:hypothetical protein